MGKNYEKLLELKRNTRTDIFIMGCNHFFNIGYNAAKKITDEDIATKVESNGIMTKEFCQELTKVARDIANAVDNSVDVVQFCEVEDIYDSDFYANKLPRYKLENMIKTLINERLVSGQPTKEDVKSLCVTLDCEAEELEMLGYEVPEEYWNEEFYR